MAEVEKDQLMVELEADIAEMKLVLEKHITRPNVKKIMQGWV